jgi:hypothetical protein
MRSNVKTFSSLQRVSYQRRLNVANEDTTYLFSQSAPTSTPKPNNPLKNVVKTEKPPDRNFSFETDTNSLLDGMMSSSLGGHSTRRRCGLLSDVITLPRAMGPSGGKSHVVEMKYSGFAFAMLLLLLDDLVQEG